MDVLRDLEPSVLQRRVEKHMRASGKADLAANLSASAGAVRNQPALSWAAVFIGVTFAYELRKGKEDLAVLSDIQEQGLGKGFEYNPMEEDNGMVSLIQKLPGDLIGSLENLAQDAALHIPNGAVHSMSRQVRTTPGGDNVMGIDRYAVCSIIIVLTTLPCLQVREYYAFASLHDDADADDYDDDDNGDDE